jgi:hypothetical protein
VLTPEANIRLRSKSLSGGYDERRRCARTGRCNGVCCWFCGVSRLTRMSNHCTGVKHRRGPSDQRGDRNVGSRSTVRGAIRSSERSTALRLASDRVKNRVT